MNISNCKVLNNCGMSIKSQLFFYFIYIIDLSNMFLIVEFQLLSSSMFS